ncbi:MAG: hypothetical protein IJB84_06550 [Lachnospiraceae bacterium]|nr:hypothetical protein [Lachnospiraceae bacterium]
MKQGAVHALKIILMVLAGAVVATLLLTLVFLVPVNEQNKMQSMQMLSEEGWYPLATVHKKAQAEYFHSNLPHVIDSNTDSIMVSIATDGSAGNPLYRAMDMYNEHMGKSYARYWHGYVSLLRPLLYFFDYGQIRILNGLMQTLLAFLLAHTIWKKKGIAFALLALTSYALIMPPAVADSLYFSGNFYVAMIGSLILLKSDTDGANHSKYLYTFTGIGMATCFFDLLTYPLYTWGIPMVWWLVVTNKEDSIWQALKKCVSSGVAWIAGYFGIWLAKWILASVVTGRNVIEDAAGKVNQWSATGEQVATGLRDRFEALGMNWSHYRYPVYMVLLLAWVVYLFVLFCKNGTRLCKNNIALLLVAVSSVVWYLVMSEHTTGHHFFAYRIWGIAILAVGVICLQAVEHQVQTGGWKKKLILIAVAALMAAGLTTTAKEDVVAFDGSVEYSKVQLEENAVARVDFTPTFSKMRSVILCMYSEGQEGIYELRVKENDRVLYTEEIPIAQYEGKTFTSIPVDWKLKAGKDYVLEISPKEISAPTYILLTNEGVMPLHEMRNVTVDGKEQTGQPVWGFTYHTLSTSKVHLLFMFACYGALSMAIVLSACSCIKQVQRVKRQMQKE